MKMFQDSSIRIPTTIKRSLLGLALSSAMMVSTSAADAIDAAKESLRKRLLEVENVVPTGKPALRSLAEYSNLTYKRSWMQHWNSETRERIRPNLDPVSASGTVWSEAIAQSMLEQNGVYIPEMSEVLYLDRSIIVESGSRIIVHPKTEIRAITNEVEFPAIRNKSIVSGQEGPVVLAKGADRNILIEGGIWGDNKNSGYGPQGFREGKFGLMLGSQGCIVLSNVENVAVRNVSFLDTSSFGLQIGNARNFLVENVCVHNTKDGVHVEGPAEFGIIRNIFGPKAGDDAVAINAWDWRTSSLTFGTISDLLVEDSDVEEGACAIRILPGVKMYPGGATEVCEVKRCIFSNIRNIHSFKMYDQPNVRDVKNDYSADLALASDLYFENIHIKPFDLTNNRDTSKNSVFEICSHVDGIYLDNIQIDYIPAKPNAEFLMIVGPKSRIGNIPFKKTGTQEIFNPKASPVAKNIVIRNVFSRPQGSTEDYAMVLDTKCLVHATSIEGGGKGTVESLSAE